MAKVQEGDLFDPMMMLSDTKLKLHVKLMLKILDSLEEVRSNRTTKHRWLEILGIIMFESQFLSW